MMKLVLSYLLGWGVRVFGSKIYDAETNVFLGKAFIFAFSGRVWIIGYSGDSDLIPVWQYEDRVRYWRAGLGFTTYKGDSWNNE